MQRRTLLASIGSAAVGLQAGCLAGDADPRTDDGGDPTDADENPVVVDHAIETTATGCMTGDGNDRVSVAFGADGVALDGAATTPNPCHEAAIASAAAGAGELRVRIEFEPTGDVCVECVGAIEYAATIEVNGADGLDAVTVEHGDAGGTHTVRRGGS